MAEKTTSVVEVLQGVVVVVGVTVGVIPLVRVTIFDGEIGRWLSWVPGTEASPGDWAVPLAVVVVAAAVVLALERLPSARRRAPR